MNITSKRTKNKRRNSIVAIMLVAALAITGALAFLTAKDSAENKFTVGNVDIELTEPSWVEADGENIVPGQVIAKDPTITNTGKNDAYVYMMVSVPKADDVSVGEEKVNDLQLFTYDLDRSWTLVDSKIDNDDLYNYYLYAYNTALAPEAKTIPAFSSVKFANVAEGQFTEANNMLQVLVDGYAIQSDFYNKEAGESATAATAWKLFAKQNNWAWPSNPATAHYTLMGYRSDPIKTVGYSSESDNITLPAPVSMQFDGVSFGGWVSESGQRFNVGDETTVDKLYILDANEEPINPNPIIREYVVATVNDTGTEIGLPVKLMPKNDTCDTVIVRSELLNKTGSRAKYVDDSAILTESNVTGYTDPVGGYHSFGRPTTEYPYTFNQDNNWYICGIEPGTTLKEFINSYVRVQGDGRLEITTSSGAMVGTGTVVSVYDRHGTETVEDDTLVEQFTVIVYGDLNGDARVDNLDENILNCESLGITGWSYCNDESFNELYVLSGDCNKDGRIQSVDVSTLIDVINNVKTLNQTFIRSSL